LYACITCSIYVAKVFSNSDLVHNHKKQNPRPLIREIVNVALDDTAGIIQHKTAFVKHLTNQKFNGEHFYESFIDQTNLTTVKYEPHIFTDFRTLNELKSLESYCFTYGSDIVWALATLDSRPANFPHANQTNPDFWVSIAGKVTYQDDKSGMDMLKHSSKGSIGVLTYDHTGNNIQMTSEPITVDRLINYNKIRLTNLASALKNDSIHEEFSIMKAILDAKNYNNKMIGKSFDEVHKLHNDIQYILWKSIQCNPKFTQSVSFVFLNKLIKQPFNEQEHRFSKTFQSKLQRNKLYNLDKQGDVKELYKAFINAGNEIDPQFIQKLHYLHHHGMTLTNTILLIVNDLFKNG
jgi:hypothetical protein